jgi:choline dehydrogenase
MPEGQQRQRLRARRTEAIGLLRSDPAQDGPDLHSFPIAPEAPEYGAGFMIGLSLLAPHSRGRLRLASSDPAAAPIVGSPLSQ